jgi:hypothetical protein
MIEDEDATEDVVAGTTANPAAAAAAVAAAAPAPAAIRRMSVIHALEFSVRVQMYAITLLAPVNP